MPCYHKITIATLLTTVVCLSSVFAEDATTSPTPTTTAETPTDTPTPPTRTPTTTATNADNVPQGANRFSASGRGVERELGSVADVIFIS
ncbi:MAG: hypothetical protein R3E08_00900 [Thiotrichaceae bacterium]